MANALLGDSLFIPGLPEECEIMIPWFRVPRGIKCHWGSESLPINVGSYKVVLAEFANDKIWNFPWPCHYSKKLITVSSNIGCHNNAMIAMWCFSNDQFLVTQSCIKT